MIHSRCWKAWQEKVAPVRTTMEAVGGGLENHENSENEAHHLHPEIMTPANDTKVKEVRLRHETTTLGIVTMEDMVTEGMT